MTGGAIANSKVYLKQCSVLNEETCGFEPLQDMNYSRDAHGITQWRNRYIIVVGSWHCNESMKTCEMYDIETDKWSMLPALNESTCAPGLIVVNERFLYKLGGTSDIGKVEMLDLEKPKYWISINTANKFGRKHTINRCLLFQLPPPRINDEKANDDGKFLVLGCHFGRSEKPFEYDIQKNKY